ncbi:hypothetical protein A4X09_0g3248 [Tilletia walkeri]|uniref:Phosphoinositide phospholipase C n=1 Tax=Tilletia walkeri TaxID=117179 RepID=A0A8X7T4Z4_9BASI|nr:hypothetical protein A4X09_0g3248 [Tilletia walkeri]
MLLHHIHHHLQQQQQQHQQQSTPPPTMAQQRRISPTSSPRSSSLPKYRQNANSQQCSPNLEQLSMSRLSSQAPPSPSPAPASRLTPINTGLKPSSATTSATTTAAAAAAAAVAMADGEPAAVRLLGVLIPYQLLQGESFQKITPKKTKERFLRLDVDQGRILWNSKRKNYIDIDLISEVRVGADAVYARRECNRSEAIASRWMSIHYKRPGAYKTVHLIAQSEASLQRWRNTLLALQRTRDEILLGIVGDSSSYNGGAAGTNSSSSTSDSSAQYTGAIDSAWELAVRREQFWLRQHWRTSNANKDEELDFDGVYRLCRRVGLKAPKRDLQAHFQAADVSKRGALNFDDFVRFVKFLKRRTEVEALFERWADVCLLEDKAIEHYYQGQGVRRRRSASAPYPKGRRLRPAGDVGARMDEGTAGVLRPVQMQARIQSAALEEDPEQMESRSQSPLQPHQQQESEDAAAAAAAALEQEEPSPLLQSPTTPMSWEAAGGTIRRRGRKSSAGGLLYQGGGASQSSDAMPSFGGAMNQSGLGISNITVSPSSTLLSPPQPQPQPQPQPSQQSQPPQQPQKQSHPYSHFMAAATSIDVNRLGISLAGFTEFLRQEQKMTEVSDSEIRLLFNKYWSVHSGAIHLEMFTAFLMSPDNALVMDQCPFLIGAAKRMAAEAEEGKVPESVDVDGNEKGSGSGSGSVVNGGGGGSASIKAFLQPVVAQNSSSRRAGSTDRSQTRTARSGSGSGYDASGARPTLQTRPSTAPNGVHPRSQQRQGTPEKPKREGSLGLLPGPVTDAFTNSDAAGATASPLPSNGIPTETLVSPTTTVKANGPVNSSNSAITTGKALQQKSGLIYHDMTRPLSEYYVSSSHNTYLVGYQWKGGSTIEGYIRALQRGARSVEIDCWPGKDNAPEVRHGMSLITPVPFVDVVETLSRYAFVSNPYPLIVSLELHIDPPQQDEVARILKERLGDVLLTEALPGRTEDGMLPSPEDLRGKILIKTKNLYISESDRRKVKAGEKTEITAVEIADGYTTGSETNESEGTGEAVISSIKNAITKRTSRDKKEKEKEKKKGPGKKALSASLASLLVYTIGVSFQGWNADEDHKYEVEHMISLGEGDAIKHIKESKELLVRHNMTHLTRVWPSMKGMKAFPRLQSANFSPHDMWAAGCQLVALNWQTPDLGMQLNHAMFVRNGKCGYVLKPEALRLEDQCRDSTDRLRFAIDIKIISAQQLPRFNDVSQDKDKDSDVIDPYVALSIHTPECWGSQPASVDVNRGFFGGVSPPLGTPTSTSVNGFDFEPPRRSSTALSFAASTAGSSLYAPGSLLDSTRRMRRSDSVSSVSSVSTSGAGKRTSRLRTHTIKGNGFNPVWNSAMSIALEVPAGDLTMARASELLGDEASGRADNIRGLSRGLLDLCFVKFEVYEENQLDTSCLATYSACLGSMLQGYRHVPLYDADLFPHRFSTLFVHVNTRYLGISPGK